MTLLWLWFLPVISGVILNLLSSTSQIKYWSLTLSVLIFTYTFSLWFLYDLNSFGFYALEHIEWFTYNNFSLSLTLGIDGVSLLFLILSTFLMPVCLLSSYNLTFYSNNFFCLVYFLLEFFLIGCFTNLNLLAFFLCFEAIVPLMFLIIGIFGSSLNNVNAARYFFIYTFFGSLLMLIGIMWLFINYQTLSFRSLAWISIPYAEQNWIWLCFFTALTTNLPLIPFHLWLPQARVEAPVSGSVLLAGVLLKLGGYGFISFVFPLLPDGNNFFSPIMLTLSTISLFFAAMTTLSQTDFNSFIAYSSISRMAIVTFGLFSQNEIAFSGSIVLMLAHGFSSSGLFMVVSLLYNSHHTSSINYYSGLTQTMPMFSILFFSFSLANLALPSTMNFTGEIMVLIGLFQSFPMLGLVANLSVVLSAAYSLFLFNSISFGIESVYLMTYSSDVSSVEFYSLLPLVGTNLFFGLNSSYLTLIQPASLNNFF